MKALVYTAPNEVVYRDEPNPIAGDGEVLIDVDAVGICGSDMHAYLGHDPRRVPPLILGHELVGRIIDGPGKGRRVTVNPLITCGACEYCLQGRDNLCANRTMIGMTRAGGFAELMSTASRSVIEVPDDMSTRAAALTEPAATALHAIHMASRALVRPLAECNALVLGGGAIGVLCALLLRSCGVRHVDVAETNALRRRSLAHAVQANVYDPSAHTPEPNHFDLVVDAVGRKSTRNAAIASVKAGGVVMHVGLMEWASEIDMRRLTLAEITLIGTYTYSMADMRAAVRALYGGAFGTLEWVDERPLAQGAEAFRDLHEGRSAASKIVLRP